MLLRWSVPVLKPRAYERAKLAADVIRERLERVTSIKADALRFDFIGISTLLLDGYGKVLSSILLGMEVEDCSGQQRRFGGGFRLIAVSVAWPGR